jgi:hypothetical protein
MRFEPTSETLRVREEGTRWADLRLRRIGTLEPLDRRGWRDLVDFGLLFGTLDGVADIDVTVAMLAFSRGGLPGPVLEAELACAAGGERVADRLRAGDVVTSVGPGPDGPVLVPWGAASDLIVDQITGETLAEGPLETVSMPIPMMFGELASRGSVRTTDRLQSRRWLLAAALVTGLGTGALELASDHVRSREQFGRTLSSFQAVQLPLAEAALLLESAELSVIDAARRSDGADERADVAAALAWLNASTVSEFVERHTHQVFGALGFTTEIGLVQLTYQMAWLRSSVGRQDAVDLIASRRLCGEEVPPSVLMDGFATAGGDPR